MPKDGQSPGRGRDARTLLRDACSVGVHRSVFGVEALIAGLDTTLGVIRVLFLASAGLVAVVCVTDWAVRTRRINPFSGVARFFRTSVDPLLAPVERRVLRFGGVPSSAPWWALGFVVVAGILAIAALGFIRDQIIWVAAAVGAGPRGMLRLLLGWAFGVLQIALLVTVISSWIRISPYSRWIRWAFVLTEPILRPLRRIVPSIGMFDVTPLVAYFLIWLVSSVILRAV